MRVGACAAAVGAIALVAASGWSGGAAAEKSKMGCEKGTETWDATQGKCVPGQSKWGKRPSPEAASTAKAAPPPAMKKAPAAKAKKKKPPAAK